MVAASSFTSFLAERDQAVGRVWATVTLLSLVPHEAKTGPATRSSAAPAATDLALLLIEIIFILLLPKVEHRSGCSSSATPYPRHFYAGARS